MTNVVQKLSYQAAFFQNGIFIFNRVMFTLAVVGDKKI